MIYETNKSKKEGEKITKPSKSKDTGDLDILRPTDVTVAKTGENGCDVKLSKIAKRILPYQFECKYQERLSTLHRWFNQSRKHGRLEPMLVVKMNDKKPLLVMDLDHFFEIVKE